METHELKFLLLDAKSEIVNLRSRNRILEAQVGVIEVFGAALGLNRGSGGMAPDVAWALQKTIDELSVDSARES